MGSAETPLSSRLLVFAGGLCGAAGVALSAMAAHKGGAFTGTAANFLLMHAPAFLAAGLLGANRFLRRSALVLLAGLTLFCGDLLMRDFTGDRLFAFAAPTGGTLLIAGWLAMAASAFAGSNRPS
ncbi:DUF423 domain-containing protein [Mesorhizobium sp. SP-1A]|uniref:DUF423 domain-containing protein n=1 Tax=Mesorhizobium sp. SP-1A TaxID=3077840 RepID=UPI0028F6ED4A|nr:DUF423 domain-containing protein [Mesorhizobium sp. SP-1A]